jgi:lipopolysaccharide heptosyltransferase II
MKVDKSGVKKILFISLSNIGDVILTTPALRVISESFPGARLDVMVGPNGAELFKRHPAVFKVITYDKHISLGEKRRLIKKLRSVKYDLIADMRNSLFPFLLGSRYRTSPIRPARKGAKHKKLQHVCKLSSIGIGLDAADAPFYLHVPPEDAEYAERIIGGFDKDKPIVAISPGAKSEIKRWPKESYAELAKRLSGEMGAQIIMVGDKADSFLIRDIGMSLKDDIADLSGKTTLCQLTALLKHCDLLITNDSAPLHIAGAVGTKVLAIFGPTNPEDYGPTGGEDCVVKRKLHCSPCGKAQCGFEHECMRDIKADEVFNVAKKMLRKHAA